MMKRENEGWVFQPPQQQFSCRVAEIESAIGTCKRTGKSLDFYRFLYPEWVNIVAITKNLELVAIQQYRFGTNKVELEIPGGVIEEGETAVEGGCRELLEETGYGGKHARVIGKVCPNPALQRNYCHTLLVEGVEKVGDQQQDDMEDIEVLLIPIDQVEDMMRKGEIQHGLVLNALMFYFMGLRSG